MQGRYVRHTNKSDIALYRVVAVVGLQGGRHAKNRAVLPCHKRTRFVRVRLHLHPMSGSLARENPIAGRFKYSERARTHSAVQGLVLTVGVGSSR